MKMKAIAYSIFWMGKKGHSRRQVELTIWKPEVNPTGVGEYRCGVLAPGMDEKRFIIGEDSTQALMLGIAHVLVRIGLQMERGWKFYSGKTDRKSIDPRAHWMLKTTEAEQGGGEVRG